MMASFDYLKIIANYNLRRRKAELSNNYFDNISYMRMPIKVNPVLEPFNVSEKVLSEIAA
jgi:hypothetical protein